MDLLENCKDIDCEIREISHEFKTEFVFKNREEMDLFLKNIHHWNEREKREKAEKELTRKIKDFQINQNISNLRTARKIYLEQLARVENVVNEKI